MPSYDTATAMPKLWSDLDREIRHLFSEDIYREWFQPLVCTDATGESLTLRTPTEFSSLWISQNYLDIPSYESSPDRRVSGINFAPV